MEREPVLELPDRAFVRHKNDTGVPSGRTVEAARRVPAPRVTVIIPTADGDRGGRFHALLAQLETQTFQDFELVTVTGDIRQGRAINTGAALAQGEYLLTLDDDSALGGPDLLARLVAAMDADPAVGMAGGLNRAPPDAPFLARRVMREVPRRQAPLVDTVTDSDLAEHGCLMMRKDAFLKAGGEHELIPRGLDPYLRREFRSLGYRVVVVPGAVYHHLPPARLVPLLRQFHRNGTQAAYAQVFYKEWLFETPGAHVSAFPARRPLSYRILRHAVNMASRLARGHVVYAAVYSAYALGFVTGYARYRKEQREGRP
jgi:glycosyltransferase involved in cell wall biosynthesis